MARGLCLYLLRMGEGQHTVAGENGVLTSYWRRRFTCGHSHGPMIGSRSDDPAVLQRTYALQMLAPVHSEVPD